MVIEFENTLRKIIIDVLGTNSTNYGISNDRIEKWEEKKVIETKKNKGVSRESRTIYYSDFYDLKTIIIKKWDLFLPIFKDKKRFEIFFDEIESYRNTISHGRELLKSQLLLMEGIVLDLKNQKTMHHNKNEKKEDYFIKINQVSDNLGNIWTSKISTNNPILRVGDNYEINIDANDPKGRQIKYEVKTILNKFLIESNSNSTNFTIPEKLIKQSQHLIIVAKTDEKEYENQDLLSITLTVLPEK